MRSITTRQIALFAAIAVVTIVSGSAVGFLVRAQRTLFADYLDSYLSIHRFRATLSRSTTLMDRFLRESSESELAEYESLLPSLRAMHRDITEASTGLLEDYFQVRAMRFGLLAYRQQMEQAALEHLAGADGAYATFVRAQRIARYVDSYAERLLSLRFDIGEAELAELTRRATTISTVSASVMVLLVLSMIVFAIVFARTVTRPIAQLAGIAHRIAEGDLDAPMISVRSRNEVGTLAHAFSTMQTNIRQLITDLEGKRELELRAARLSESLREAQLMGLQAQINPHFLFNTLNAISRTALFEGAKTTTELIQSLSQVFRYMLQQPSSTVSLREELRIAEEYVKLQKQRFHERLEFTLTCDVDADSVRVPALTLQPLIENAIRHGIEPSERGGSIAVACTRSDGNVHISVQDTGLGMVSPEVASSGPEGNGMGLQNVRARLELLHGDNLSFIIHSSEGAGTTVDISFPEELE